MAAGDYFEKRVDALPSPPLLLFKRVSLPPPGHLDSSERRSPGCGIHKFRFTFTSNR